MGDLSFNISMAAIRPKIYNAIAFIHPGLFISLLQNGKFLIYWRDAELSTIILRGDKILL